MRALGVVVHPPSFKDGAHVRQRAEQRLIEQLVAQAADERFREGILYRFARRDVMPGDLVIVCPPQDGVRGQLGTIVTDDGSGLATLEQEAVGSRATRMPEIEVSATSARHSRVQSSTTTRMRMRRPSMN
jgi:hypothetical protein